MISAVSCSNSLNDANRNRSNNGSNPAPAAPDLSASDSQITVSWASVINAVGYRVYYNTENSPTTALEYTGSSGITGTSCTITGLKNNVVYYIWVQAQYSAGSAISPSSSATPATATTAPQAPGITAIIAGNTQLSVQWNAVTGATRYEVYTGTVSDSSAAVKYTGDANTSDLACTVTGLTNGTVYYIMVKAVNSIGSSDFSTAVPGTPVASVIAPSAPSAPMITAGDTKLTVSWTAITEASEYEVYYGTSDDSSSAVTFSGDSITTDTSCTITGLTNGTIYYVWVKAVNSIGSSDFSTSASGTPVLAATPPSAPGMPQITNGYTKLMVTWTAITDATSYEVYYGTTNDSSSAVTFSGDSTATDTACTLTGLSNGITYYVWIKSVNAIGSSDFSASASGTPSAALQPGTLDTTLSSAAESGYTIYATAVQSDGKILIGGAFSSYNGTTRLGVARLNADGSIDTSFDSSNGAKYKSNNATIYAIAVQADGKILIGGYFTSYGGVTQNGITRLNTDGSYDTSFNFGNTGISDGGQIKAISVLSSGKILIGGMTFTTYNGSSVGRFARLNSDGTFDNTFNVSGSGADSSVRAIDVQSDGKIIIGGSFLSYNGTSSYYLARINSDGTFDSTFSPGKSINNDIYALKISSEGKIIIGGDLTKYGTTTVGHFAQINSDGSLDTTFNTNIGTGTGSTIQTLAVQTDGKIIIGGSFTSPYNRLARFNSDGSADTTFSVGSGANSIVYAITLQSDGNILIGGGFTSYNGTTRNYLARLLGN